MHDPVAQSLLPKRKLRQLQFAANSHIQRANTHTKTGETNFAGAKNRRNKRNSNQKVMLHYLLPRINLWNGCRRLFRLSYEWLCATISLLRFTFFFLLLFFIKFTNQKMNKSVKYLCQRTEKYRTRSRKRKRKAHFRNTYVCNWKKNGIWKDKKQRRMGKRWAKREWLPYSCTQRTNVKQRNNFESKTANSM